MLTSTALAALSQRPLSFLRSNWPWRCLAYLLSSVVPGTALVATVVWISHLGSVPLMVVVGLVIVGLLTPVVARFEWWRLRLVDLVPVSEERSRL